MSNLNVTPIEVIEVIESNSGECFCTRTTRCFNKRERKLNRFIFTVIGILSILVLIFVLYHVNFLRENAEDNIPSKERDGISTTERVRNDITNTSTNYSISNEEMLNDPCLTRECMIALEIPIDSSTYACNDFYEFACGGIYPQEDPFEIDWKSVYKELKILIENEIGSEDSRVFQLVKNFYSSCMNQTEIEAVKVEQFNRILRKIGDWPLFEGQQWNEADFDWIESIRKLRDIGLTTNQLFGVGVGSNFKNSSIKSLMISQPEFKLPRHFLLNDTEPLLQNYYSSMVVLASTYGAHFDSFTLHEIVDVFTFERHLANISLPEEELRDYEMQNNPFKISELEMKYPYIRWMDYFDAIMPADMKNITSDEVVIVTTPGYFDRLGEVLQNTSKRTIATYFVWRILAESLSFASDPYEKYEKSFKLIPLALRQGALFSDKRPNYMNYGIIGQIIGHEIAHGLDDVGRQFDLHGNLKDWWLPETKLKFLDKAKCVIEQYGNFTIPNTELKVNGKLTLDENIADIVGLKSAYYAYSKWLERNNDRPLPGFENFTPKQMFWISFAQTWCSSVTDSIATIITDPHSPNRVRVIGALRNNKEFATDFECAQGTPMNPIEKCEIW